MEDWFGVLESPARPASVPVRCEDTLWALEMPSLTLGESAVPTPLDLSSHSRIDNNKTESRALPMSKRATAPRRLSNLRTETTGFDNDDDDDDEEDADDDDENESDDSIINNSEDLAINTDASVNNNKNDLLGQSTSEPQSTNSPLFDLYHNGDQLPKLVNEADFLGLNLHNIDNNKIGPALVAPQAVRPSLARVVADATNIGIPSKDPHGTTWNAAIPNGAKNFLMHHFANDFLDARPQSAPLHSSVALPLLSSLPPKRNSYARRRQLTAEEVEYLVEVFNECDKPNAALRSQLAQQLGMTARAIQIWFQNKRAKRKKLEPASQQNNMSQNHADPAASPDASTNFYRCVVNRETGHIEDHHQHAPTEQMNPSMHPELLQDLVDRLRIAQTPDLHAAHSPTSSAKKSKSIYSGAAPLIRTPVVSAIDPLERVPTPAGGRMTQSHSQKRHQQQQKRDEDSGYDSCFASPSIPLALKRNMRSKKNYASSNGNAKIATTTIPTTASTATAQRMAAVDGPSSPYSGSPLLHRTQLHNRSLAMHSVLYPNARRHSVADIRQNFSAMSQSFDADNVALNSSSLHARVLQPQLASPVMRSPLPATREENPHLLKPLPLYPIPPPHIQAQIRAQQQQYLDHKQQQRRFSMPPQVSGNVGVLHDVDAPQPTGALGLSSSSAHHFEDLQSELPQPIAAQMCNNLETHQSVPTTSSMVMQQRMEQLLTPPAHEQDANFNFFSAKDYEFDSTTGNDILPNFTAAAYNYKNVNNGYHKLPGYAAADFKTISASHFADSMLISPAQDMFEGMGNMHNDNSNASFLSDHSYGLSNKGNNTSNSTLLELSLESPDLQLSTASNPISHDHFGSNIPVDSIFEQFLN